MRLVVGEVAGHLLGGERVRPQLHGQHQVGLLAHLLAVEVEVGHVQQQRVHLLVGVLEVPHLVVGEALGSAGARPRCSSYGIRIDAAASRQLAISSEFTPSRAAARACRAAVSAATRRFSWAIRLV